MSYDWSFTYTKDSALGVTNIRNVQEKGQRVTQWTCSNDEAGSPTIPVLNVSREPMHRRPNCHTFCARDGIFEHSISLRLLLGRLRTLFYLCCVKIWLVHVKPVPRFRHLLLWCSCRVLLAAPNLLLHCSSWRGDASSYGSVPPRNVCLSLRNALSILSRRAVIRVRNDDDLGGSSLESFIHNK